MSDQDKPTQHILMTTEDAVAWNKSQELRPLSENHWMVKAAKVKRRLILSMAWKRLAKKQRKQIFALQDLVQEQEIEITRLSSLARKKK